MHPLLKRILATLAGVVVAALVIYLLEAIGHILQPPPPEVDLHDPASLEAYLEVAPFLIKLMVVIGWVVGCFTGGWVAGRIYRDNLVPSVLVGLVLLVASILNMTQFTHPLWMWVSAIIGMVPAAWWGGRLALQRLASNHSR